MGLQAGRKPRYVEVEFRRLVGGVGGEHFRRSVRRLEQASLGIWREDRIELLGARKSGLKCGGRLVPIPRPLVRHLASSKGRAYIATGLGHVLRCTACVDAGAPLVTSRDRPIRYGRRAKILSILYGYRRIRMR
jgi:hypothetical protein